MAKILVVDDDPDVVMSTRLCLEAEGHEVIDAKNGTECLARVRNSVSRLDHLGCDDGFNDGGFSGYTQA